MYIKGMEDAANPAKERAPTMTDEGRGIEGLAKFVVYRDSVDPVDLEYLNLIRGNFSSAWEATKT